MWVNTRRRNVALRDVVLLCMRRHANSSPVCALLSATCMFWSTRARGWLLSLYPPQSSFLHRAYSWPARTLFCLRLDDLLPTELVLVVHVCFETSVVVCSPPTPASVCHVPTSFGLPPSCSFVAVVLPSFDDGGGRLGRRCRHRCCRVIFLCLFLQVDKDGNVQRTASTFRSTVAPNDPVHTPGAWVRSKSEFGDRVSLDDPHFKPGELGGGPFSSPCPPWVRK